MVYCGKPSRGCQNCKTRRIKCDEVRPSCTQCRKSSRVCPGYPDEFDLIFRNETAAVKRRAQRAFSNASSKTSKSTTTRKTTLSPKQPSLVWEDSPVGESPRSEKLEWLDDSHSSLSRPQSSRRSPQAQYTPQQSTALSLHWTHPIEPRIYDADEISPVYQQPSAPAPEEEDDRTTKNQLRLFSPNVPLPRSLDSADQRRNYAVGFFFKNLVQMPRSKDSLRGYVEVLGPMYLSAKPDSLLHQATQALALASLSNGRKSPLLRVEARKIYGNALREVGLAIKDPQAARSDEVLMSIMLFSLYEAITSTDESRTVWTRHINGAVTLVKLRGEEQLKNPTSLHLFRAVRASMLTASIQQGRTVEDFPSANGWKCDADLGVNAANRLTMICLNLPNIKYYAQDLLSRDKTSSTVIDMMTLIRTAKDIDSELEHWANTLPDFWNPSTKMIFTGEMFDDKEFLKKAEFWPGPVHIYGDLSIANVWNDYRVSRIFCQAVILGCVAALPSHARTDQIERISQQAVHITQEMVNDFSSAIPYMLGYDIKSRKDGVADTAAKATGAYFAVWPLFVTKKIPTVPELQKKWLLYRLYLIGSTFGLSEDQVLHMAQKHVLTSGPSFDYIDPGANLDAPQDTLQGRRTSVVGAGIGAPSIQFR
ncbi:hypothetical protein FKW77_008552 [Venturia effusa]|uniref:Zn(2)-C6 fungal-type domain-containing protein n=1 Tax=Venturia effusa TaxID=50376 RepID=A0A517L7V8_9PEZI|nr:hypothetical protein FKW77_008552 [Venturia effusa]